MTYWYPLAVPTIGDEEIAAATEVLQSGQTTMGDKVAEFEERFAQRVGARYAVMVNSGSSADLLVAFITSGHKGEVLIPAVTWPTHVWSWKVAGFKPRFVDVDELNVTPEIIDSAVTAQAVGVSVPHLMGVPARIDEIASAAPTMWITEDCCEALGAGYKHRNVGSVGHAAAWSFFFSHHMTTMEGGMVTTRSGATANRLRAMRAHGWARDSLAVPGLDPRYTFIDIGFNLRPSEISAAIGLVQLEKLDVMNRARRKNHDTFTEGLRDCERVHLPAVPKGGYPSWFGLPMFVDERASLQTWLEAHGVETRPILGGNLARQPAFQGLGMVDGPLPGADYVHDHGLYVGLHPIESQIGRVAELIKKWSVR
jgi:CDP-6-deoxy-D-xylo-4-hexulose-3-dehydrase